MAVTINWATQVINVPRADMLLVQSVPTEIRELDIDAFRLDLKDIEDSDDGMAFVDTHSHNGPVTVGGVTLARVVEIINGYTVTFEDGQYAVNLVGANSNIADVTNVNQVSVRSANSAGLTYSEQINDQSFAGAVWIDSVGLSGTQFPRGTPTDPVNNFVDAETIAVSRKLNRFNVAGSLTIPASTDLDTRLISGEEAPQADITLGAGCSTLHTGFRRVELTGGLDGHTHADQCILNVTNFAGIANFCALQSVTLDPTPSIDESHGFFNCHSDIPGTGKPVLDCNGTTKDVQVRRYVGGLEVRNFTAGNVMTLDVISGSVLLSSSCTAGTIVVRGVVQLTDESGPGCTVVTSGVVSGEDTQLTTKLLRNKLIIDPNTGTATLYEDDSATPLISGLQYEDAAGTQTYRSQGLERRERME
jgi:hypothetical protein